MADPLKGLSQDDVRVLQSVIDWARRQGLNTSGRFPRERTYAEGDDQMAPEVYVAKTPSGGIDGLTSGDGGTGTAGYDEPGSADCDVYTIDETDDTPDLRDIGKDLVVYNVSVSEVAGSIYVPIFRDKFGRWLVVNRGVNKRRFKLAEALVEDSNADAYLVSVVGSVLIATGTTFTVHDGMSEFSGDAGTLGLAEYWDDMSRWEVYQLACAASDSGTGTGTP